MTHAAAGRDASGVSEAWWLAGGTALAYAVAFAYESGQAEVYGYPLDLIDVQLMQLLLSASSFLILLGLIQNLDFIAFLLPKETDGPVTRHLKPIGFFWLLGAAVWLVGRPASNGAVLGFLGMTVLLLLLDFGMPLLTRRGSRHTYREELHALSEAHWQRHSRTHRALGIRSELLIAFVVAFSLLVVAFLPASVKPREEDTTWLLNIFRNPLSCACTGNAQSLGS